MDNPGTAGLIDWAGQAYLAKPHHTNNVLGYSNSSLGQLLESGLSQGIGDILGTPSPAVGTNGPGGPTIIQMKRNAVDCENDKLPRKKGLQANVAILCNPRLAEHDAPTIARSCRERRVSEKVAAKLAEEAAAKLAEEAATKAARESAKEAKATKAKEKTQTRGSSQK